MNKGLDHEYAPIDGIASYVNNSIKLAYGENSSFIKDKRIAGAQSISGTGSIRLGLEYIKRNYPKANPTVYIPKQTWPIHKTVCDVVGLKWADYRYYDTKTKSFDCNGMLEDLDKAEPESIVFFHVCAHNPTGCDPQKEDWKKILEVVKRKQLLCLFDSAYQGFASGSLEEDAYSLRLFSQEYDRLMLFQSYAKNFGLYGERAGCFSVVCDSEKERDIVMSRVKQMARNLYSNPPINGARIVDTVLNDK